MKLYVFGTCSGTEPYPGRHHCAFAIEINDNLFWFDAGEGCSYTAHLMGVDLMKLRKVVISHPHLDHVLGLDSLFRVVRKLDGLHHNIRNTDIDLYIPYLRTWEGIYQTICGMEDSFTDRFSIHAQEYGDGLLFEDCGLRVTALHNHHLPHEDGTPWRSFGFLIEGEGKRIVYTGDTGGVYDYEPLLDRCNLLITETGHHHPPEVARELKERGLFPDKLAFIHHGRDFLDRYDEQISALDSICPGEYIVFDDGMTLDV